MREVVEGRLVLAEDVVPGRLVVEDGWIADVATDPGNAAWAAGPILAPGLIDVHVHGWGGHDGTGDADALSGMARALLRQGITSFLPTAPSLPEPEIPRFAARVRDWMPSAPADGAEPLGFNLEGPFIAPGTQGRPRSRAPAHAGEHRPGRHRCLAGRAADHDDRPGAAAVPWR